MKILFVVTLILSFSSFGRHGHETKLQREYYDYDVKGTRKDQVKHNIGHGLVLGVTSPFRAVSYSYRGIRKVVQRASRNAQMFFKESPTMSGDHKRVHNVLRGWENSEDLQSILERENAKGNRFLFGIPYDAYRLLKDMLMAAGVHLPRAGWHALRAILTGCVNFSGI